jgi:hypothetical protein
LIHLNVPLVIVENVIGLQVTIHILPLRATILPTVVVTIIMVLLAAILVVEKKIHLCPIQVVQAVPLIVIPINVIIVTIKHVDVLLLLQVQFHLFLVSLRPQQEHPFVLLKVITELDHIVGLAIAIVAKIFVVHLSILIGVNQWVVGATL